MIEQIFIRFHEPTNPDALQYLPMVMRTMEGMRVERNHWTYSGLREDGTRVGLWGGDALYPVANSVTLKAPMLIDHQSDRRAPKQLIRCGGFAERVAQYVSTHDGFEP